MGRRPISCRAIAASTIRPRAAHVAASLGHSGSRSARSQANRRTSCIESAGEPGGIRALFVMGSNPVVSAPNATQVAESAQAASTSSSSPISSCPKPRARRRRAAVGAVGGRGRHHHQSRRAGHPPPARDRLRQATGADRHRHPVRARASALGKAQFFPFDGCTRGCLRGAAARQRAAAPADYSGITYDRHRSRRRACSGRARPKTIPERRACSTRRFPTPSGRARFHAVEHRRPGRRARRAVSRCI